MISPSVRIVIAEELTRAVFRSHAALFTAADACWAVNAFDWTAARLALDDGRWRTGDFRLFDAVEERLGRWVRDIVDAQAHDGAVMTLAERALFTYGLYVRMIGAARAKAIAEDVLRQVGAAAARIDIIASDPYLRAIRVGGADPRPRDLRTGVHPFPGRSALVAGLRERAVGTAWLRTVNLARGWLRTPARRRVGRRAGLFILGRSHADPLSSFRRELRRRGWDLTVFNYDPAALTEPDAIPFGVAVDLAGGRPVRVGARAWRLSADIARQGPVSSNAVRSALSASWVTGTVQTERHKRVLDAWEPDVVLSFGPDTMSHALQAAARSRGIPSVFISHSFLHPSPLNWVLPAAASAVPGSGCIDANAVNPLGEPQSGLVAVGHPPYDEIVPNPSVPPADLARLDITPSRRQRVLFFNVWAQYLLDQAMMRRTLAMLAVALPSDAFLICKLHPGQEDRAICEEVLGERLPADAFAVVSSREFSTPGLLRVCDVAVATEESTALVDAVVMDVPAIAVRHPESVPGTGPLKHPARIGIAQVASIVSSEGELRDALRCYANAPQRRSWSRPARDEYIARFLTSADGRSSSRLADLVERLAGAGMRAPVDSPARIT